MMQDLYRIQFDLAVLAEVLAEVLEECRAMRGQSVKLVRAMSLLAEIQSKINKIYAAEVVDDPK